MADTKTTTDHSTIKRWTEDRNGTAAMVTDTKGGDDGAVIRLLFDDESTENAGLEKVSWDKFFQQFDDHKLALLHSTEAGNTFNKLVSRN